MPSPNFLDFAIGSETLPSTSHILTDESKTIDSSKKRCYAHLTTTNRSQSSKNRNFER